jgi:hypothetical protein
MAEEVDVILSRYRFRFSSESPLQQGISSALTIAKIDHQREVRLDQDSRLDFLCDGGLAIEVKISGNFTRAELIRQITRYAESDRVEMLLVVSSRFIADMPATLNGKPLIVHVLLASML